MSNPRIVPKAPAIIPAKQLIQTKTVVETPKPEVKPKPVIGHAHSAIEQIKMQNRSDKKTEA